MTTVSRVTAASSLRRCVWGIAVSSLVLLSVPEASAQAPPSAAAIRPTDAAIALVGAAIYSLGATASLQMRLQTDWLGVSEWQAPPDVAARLAGRPFTVAIAEHKPGMSGRRIVATAEVWLTARGDLLDFRLGPEALLAASGADELRANVDALKDRTEPELRRMLADGGAVLPPGDPSGAKRRAEKFLEEIKKLVGQATVYEAEFAPLPKRPVGRAPWAGPPEQTQNITLEWFIRATTPGSDLSLRIDAISGHVIAVQSHPSR